MSHLNNPHARVEEDGSFGFLGGVLVFVEVEVVGSVSQLGQVEVPPLKGLERQHKSSCYIQDIKYSCPYTALEGDCNRCCLK